MRYVQIGGSKHTQYGNVSVEDFELIPEDKEVLNKGTKVVCTLVSPLVLLDNKGESKLDINDIAKKTGLENAEKCFVDYVQVGGYNAKWKLQKPSYTAFAAGTCFTGTLAVDTEKELQIGSFMHEGMGQIVVNTVEEIKKSIKDVEKNDDIDKKTNSNTEETIRITEDLKEIMIDVIKHKLRLGALEKLEDDRLDKIITSTLVGRLLKMLENDRWDKFKKDYEGIATAEKKDEVKVYIEKVRKKCDKAVDESNLIKYMDKNGINSYKDEFCMSMLKDLFTLTKYERRNK